MFEYSTLGIRPTARPTISSTSSRESSARPARLRRQPRTVLVNYAVGFWDEFHRRRLVLAVGAYGAQAYALRPD